MKHVLHEETGLHPTTITQVSAISHILPQTHTVTTIHRVEVDTDKVKPDQQHREYGWINTMEDDLHPYLVDMIENTVLLMHGR